MAAWHRSFMAVNCFESFRSPLADRDAATCPLTWASAGRVVRASDRCGPWALETFLAALRNAQFRTVGPGGSRHRRAAGRESAGRRGAGPGRLRGGRLVRPLWTTGDSTAAGHHDDCRLWILVGPV